MILEQMMSEKSVNFISEDNQELVLRQLARNMFKQGFVRETYEDAVVLREKKFPTGLQTETYGIAIPHTDSIHVNQAAIGLGILEKSVSFKEMGDPQTDLDVRIIFMLAIKDPNKQLEVLQVLINLIQDTKKMRRVLTCTNKEEIVSIITGKE